MTTGKLPPEEMAAIREAIEADAGNFRHHDEPEEHRRKLLSHVEALEAELRDERRSTNVATDMAIEARRERDELRRMHAEVCKIADEANAARFHAERRGWEACREAALDLCAGDESLDWLAKAIAALQPPAPAEPALCHHPESAQWRDNEGGWHCRACELVNEHCDCGDPQCLECENRAAAEDSHQEAAGTASGSAEEHHCAHHLIDRNLYGSCALCGRTDPNPSWTELGSAEPVREPSRGSGT